MATAGHSDPRWGRARFQPHWGLEHRDLPYHNEPFNNPSDLQAWRDWGYTQERFTGDLYDMRQAEPSWIQPLRDSLCLRHFSWSVYRMDPGTTLPEHTDTYARFREIYGLTAQHTIRRYVIFMEPWASGHYLEVAGQPVTQWQAGDAVFWHDDVLHLAANVGRTARYTLQITGVISSFGDTL